MKMPPRGKPPRKDRLHECVACRRMFIKPSRASVSFCSGCKGDSAKFVVLVALSLALAFVAIGAIVRLVQG